MDMEKGMVKALAVERFVAYEKMVKKLFSDGTPQHGESGMMKPEAEKD